MLTGTLPIAYFGKIPAHGDFVRHNASGAAVRAMDEWLQKGMRFATNRLVGTADAVFEATGPCAFYFMPRRAEHGLVGVLRPSRDSVGRTFPLLIAQEVGAALFDPHHLAQVSLRYNTFFGEAAEVTRKAATGHLDRHTLTEHAEALGTLVEGETSVAFFGRYLQQTTLTSFWKRLWGHPQDSRKYLLFKNLLDIVDPLRQGIPLNYPLVFRFPLCPDGKTPDFDVSFWLGVSLRLLGYPDVQPSFFWTLTDETPGPEPFLLLALRPPAPKTFAYLLPAPIESNDLCALETMGAHNAVLAALSIPDRYGRMLEDETLTLWDFLKQL